MINNFSEWMHTFQEFRELCDKIWDNDEERPEALLSQHKIMAKSLIAGPEDLSASEFREIAAWRTYVEDSFDLWHTSVDSKDAETKKILATIFGEDNP